MKRQTTKKKLKTAGRTELAQRLSKKRRIPPFIAERIVEIVFQEIEAALVKGNGAEIRGFGSFHIKHYKGYKGSHPKTAKPIQVKPKRRPVFKPSAVVKRLLNKAPRRGGKK